MALVTGGALAAAVSRAGGLGVVGGAYAGTIAKVEFENDRIRVLRVHYEPYEKMDMHEHPATVVVSLTRTHTRATLPAGTSRESRSEPGTVTWTEPERHAVENLSDEPMEDFEIELKRAKAPAVAVSPPPSGSTTPKEPMPASLEPHHHIKYQNQYIRVLEVKLEPGVGSFFHTHSMDILYVTLADAVVRAQEQRENWGPDTAFRVGEVSFENASKIPHTHRLKNVGKTLFHTISVEFFP
jgi:beta-alanine degradation protein BauB